jgi:hypothetical protein
MTTPRFVAATLVLLTVISAVVAAQRPDPPTSRLFPEPSRVLADYPDDVARWAALTALYFAAGEKSPDGQYKASYAKSTAYFSAIGTIEEAHHIGTPQEDKDFAAKIQAARRDRANTRAVLERYHLADLPTAARPPAGAASGPPLPPAPRVDPEVEFQKAVPVWLLTIGVMWLVAWVIVHRPMHYPVAPVSSTSSLVLPDAIRLVQVPGSSYGLEGDSNIVTEDKTYTETTYSTFTTPGTIQTVGDAVYRFPGQVQTVANTVVKDRLWLRDPTGQESVWVLSGGVFVVRVGHVVSRVGTRGPNGLGFIVACNHNTGQCVVFNGTIGAYHGGYGRGAWILPTLVGVVGWVYGGARLIPLLGIDPLPMAFLSFTILGVIGSPIIALFVNARVHTKLFRQRNAYFAEHYLPAIRQFLLQQSPAVLARFGVTASHP